MSSLNKSEKRRGRPPKNVKNVTIIKSKKVDKNPEEEQLVLYLPSFEEEQSEKMSLIKKDIEPQTENNFTPFDSCSEDEEKFSHLTDKNNSEEIDSFDKKKINLEKLLEEIQKRDSMINTLKSKLKDKSIFNENTLTMTKENKKQLINLGLISINKNKINICEKTHIACWWCTYNFDTQPLFMPDHYKNNMYYVFGNFCSFACMLAYNENMDDYRKGVRTALIKQLYREIFNCDDMNIKSAGPRELLDKFGGPMNITKYRDANIVSRKTFKLTIPPQIPLISDLEELVIEKK
jgi:hypothetical protein